MKVKFTSIGGPTSGVFALGVLKDGKLTPSAARMDKKTKGMLSRAIRSNPNFSGERGQFLEIPAPMGTRLT